MIALAVFAGVFTWSLLEYLIHRFLGHQPKLRPNPFATEHVRHHSEGDYFAPSWKKLLAALVFAGVLVWPVTALLGTTLGFAYLAGLMGFYGAYEVPHRREHTCAGIGAYGRWARRHHFAHHYSDARFNHGVTSPLWDVVFRTYKPVQLIRVPRKFVMPWLKDPVTGEVRADFADRFTLAK
jgi:sterol desaturase/sphingolipid hydroxylase (fatty acid hydroxylase superfamily)